MPIQSRTLRQLLHQKVIAKCAGAHNAMGARLAQMCGFDAIWSSSFEISASHCLPDASILSMSEYLDAARSISDSVAIPVIADCDTGYGNEANVRYAVRRFEAAGVAAISIEDQVFPKTNSLIHGRQQLVPVAEFQGKIQAAIHARIDPAFTVIARVEALIAGAGQQEALDRAHAYAAVGADAILMHWNQHTSEPISNFLQQWKSTIPVIVVPTTYYHVTASELGHLGASMVIYANHGLRSALASMENSFRAILKDGGTRNIEPTIWPVTRVLEEMEDIAKFPAMRSPNGSRSVVTMDSNGGNGNHDWR
jgi:phosphoenolpyruvate phosphomutase